MDDTDSITANVGVASVPSQIHQLAAVLWDILNNDRESNAAIFEKLENPGDDLSTNPVQVFTAADLAHLASHLAQTTQVLSQQALNMEELSDIDDWGQPELPADAVLSSPDNSNAELLPVFWSCVNRCILFQGLDKSFVSNSAVAKTASRQRGVYVEHLKRCKTSNLPDDCATIDFIIHVDCFSVLLDFQTTAGGAGGTDETGTNKDTHQLPVISMRTLIDVPASISCPVSAMGRG